MSDYYSIADLELTPNQGDTKLSYENYEKIRKAQEADSPSVGVDEAIARRRENMKDWLGAIPPRWRKQSLNNAPNGEEIKNSLRDRGLSSFFINGENTISNYEDGYAILRTFVNQGWVKPSSIEVISEEDFLSISQQGFRGEDLMNKMLKKHVFMIGDTGFKTFLNEKEQFLWSRLISHCFDNGLTLIVLSLVNDEAFSGLIRPNTALKLWDLVGDGIISSYGSQNLSISDKLDLFDG